MQSVKGVVRNGRLVVDELSDLPEGTEVELVAVSDGATVVAQVELGLSVDEEEGVRVALESLRAGQGMAHEDVRARVLRHVRP